MAWILLRFEHSPMFETRRGSNTMRHHNTVFHTVLKFVPWHVFDRLVEEFQANKKVRRLTTQNQFIALLYAQLSGAESLRTIEAGFDSHASKLYHLGACAVSRSTLSDANALRPNAVFVGLLGELMGRCERALQRKLAEVAHLVDSTSFRLSALSADWARFSTGVYGAKLHVVYNPDGAHPVAADITPANVNDITVAQVGQARPIRLSAGDAPESQYAARRRGRERPAGRHAHPVRPHRIPAGTPGQKPQQPLSGPGARNPPVH
jgi:hypothetical protein